MFWIQVLIYLFFFTAAIAAVVKNGPVGGLFFYPKPVQQRALELGLTDAAAVRKRKRWFFAALMMGVIGLPVLFIGLWERVTDLQTAYVQTLLLLEIMNWYDGLVMDRLWVGHSKFWAIPGCEDLPYAKSLKTVMLQRRLLSLVYLPVAAIVAELAVLVGRAV